MPHLQEVWEKNKARGLRVFAVEGDGLTALENFAFAGENKYTFPIVTASESSLASWDIKTMPNTYVVNAEGLLVFKGSEGWDGIVEKELARRPYTGLNKDKVEKDCEKAAAAFGKGDYVKAAELAKAVVEGKPSEAAVADAQMIIEACAATEQKLRAAADLAKGEKRYADCLEALDRLASGFKGTESGTKAEAEAKELRKDKDVKKELGAWQALRQALESNKKLKKAEKVKALRGVQKSQEGTEAGAKAKELATAIEGSKYFR
ncbi:hypothetical protein EDM80_02990 [bacterium]|nr:MAG: hypothetical protein EDM80_02990 [bacterium]RIK65033.1 MAG: hypothetical protein DCC64_02900 [Planctomycetota bacterium]